MPVKKNNNLFIRIVYINIKFIITIKHLFSWVSQYDGHKIKVTVMPIHTNLFVTPSQYSVFVQPFTNLHTVAHNMSHPTHPVPAELNKVIFCLLISVLIL